MKCSLLISVLLYFATANAQVIDDTVAYEHWFKEIYLPQYSADTGVFLPSVKLVDDKGNVKTIADFKGKIIYINVWDTDCGSSELQLSYENQLQKRLAAIHLDSSVLFLNICTGATQKEWKAILDKYKPVGYNLYCKDTALYTKWNIAAPPTYIVLNTSGIVTGKHVAMPQESPLIDYILYSATKNINPVNAVLENYRQSQFFTANKKYTDDENGKKYADWYSSLLPSFVETHLWEQEKQNNKNNH